MAHYTPKQLINEDDLVSGYDYDQGPEELEETLLEEAAQAAGLHHPDCQCNECYYGADLAQWAFHPAEY